MTWFEKPDVEREDAGDTSVWRLLGDWTRDLPLEVRRGAVEALAREASRLVLDLCDVKFIDSWGEETVCDVIQRVRDQGGIVAWTNDATRLSEYEGVRRALERRGLEVQSFHDTASAIEALKAAS